MTLEQQITATAAKYGVPADLALAVAYQESGLNPDAMGQAGEVGLYQLMPSTAWELGVNPYVIEENIQGGMAYLSQQYQRFGSWDAALAAYNAGPGAVAAGKVPSSTQQYVESVMSNVGWDAGYGMPTFTVTGYAKAPEFPLWMIAIGIAAVLTMLTGRRQRD